MIIILNYLSVMALAVSSARTGLKTYGDMASHLLGPKYKYLAELFFYLNNFGAVISYLVLINQNLNTITLLVDQRIVPVPDWIKPITGLYWVTLAAILLIPVVLMRNLKDLKFTSLLGLMTILYLAVAITVYGLTPSFYPVDNNLSAVKLFDLSGLSVSMSEMLFSFQSQQYIMLAYHELNDKSVRRFTKVVCRQTLICTCIYVFVGVFGYITFANRRIADLGNFLMAYDPANNMPIFAGIFALTVTLVCSVPFVLRPTKESLVLFAKGLFPIDEHSYKIHALFSLFNLSVAYTISALCIHYNLSLNTIMTWISALTSPFFSFYFPYQFYIQSSRNGGGGQWIWVYKVLCVMAVIYWILSIGDIVINGDN